MATFPSLPLWTDAYLADTRHLSQAEHGAYLLLLITAWRAPDCSLPDDDRLLARHACCDLRTWRHQKATVMAFWSLSDGRWHQKRLSAERAYVGALTSKRATAGRKGAEAKKRTSGDIEAKYPSNLAGINPESIDADMPAYDAANTLKNNNVSSAKPPICQKQTASKTIAPTPTPTPTPTKKDTPVRGATSAPRTLEQQVFDLGKRLLGSGGQVTKLRKFHDGDLEATMATLELAEGKSDPREYVGAILRGDQQPETDWKRFNSDLGVS